MAYQSNGPILFESVSNVTATPSVEVGTRVTVAGADYIYVYNTGSSTVGQYFGAVVSAVSGFSVTVSSVTMTDVAIGIAKHAAIPTGSYGWLLTRGFSKFAAGASDSFAVAGPLALGVDGVFCLKSCATGWITPVIGKATVAAASGLTGTGEAYFNFSF